MRFSGAIPWDHVGSRTSHTGAACNPDDPAMIVRILSSTVVGCQWLLDNWAELKELLDDGGVWQGNHKFKAARLMGKQPADCLNSRKIATLYVASWSLNSLRGHAYSEQRSDFGRREYRHYIRRVRATWPDMINATDHVNARRVLVGMVEKEVEAVQAKLALARERATRDEARRADCLSFDDTHTGELLRRYETASHKKFVRALNELFKLRRAAEESGFEELFDPSARRESPEAENRDPDNSDDPQSGHGPQNTDNSCNRQGDHWQPAADDSAIAPRFLPTEANEDCAAAPSNPIREGFGAEPDNRAPSGPGCEPNLRNAVGSQCEPSDTTVAGAQSAPDRRDVAGAEVNPTTWRLPTAMHLLLLIVLVVHALTLLAASDHDVAGRVDDVPTFLLAPPADLNSPSSAPADARGNDARSPDHSPRELPPENPVERVGVLCDQSLGIMQNPQCPVTTAPRDDLPTESVCQDGVDARANPHHSRYDATVLPAIKLAWPVVVRASRILSSYRPHTLKKKDSLRLIDFQVEPMLPTHHEIEHAAYELWLRRGKRHGFDRGDWLTAENELTYSMNYRSIVEYPLDAPGMLILGERPERYCRFCERNSALVAFGGLCSVVPGFRHTSLFTEAVCDECLHGCLEPLTPGFSQFWQALAAESAGREPAHDHPASGLYTTVVLKSLVAAALLIMPETELRYFVDALEWLSNPNHDDDARLFGGAVCHVQIVPSLNDRSWAGLARRIDDQLPLPYMLYSLARNGVVVQIPLPLCIRDQDLDGRPVRAPVRSFSHAVGAGSGSAFPQNRSLVLPLCVPGERSRSAGTRLSRSL